MEKIENALVDAVTAGTRPITKYEMDAVKQAMNGNYFTPAYHPSDEGYKAFRLAMTACTGWILEHSTTTVKELRGLMGELGFTFHREDEIEMVTRFGEVCGRYSMVTATKKRMLKLMQILQTETGYALPDFINPPA